MEHVNLGRGWDDQRHARLVPVVLCCFATEHYELLGLLAVYRLGHVERIDNDQQVLLVLFLVVEVQAAINLLQYSLVQAARVDLQRNATKRSTSISKIRISKLEQLELKTNDCVLSARQSAGRANLHSGSSRPPRVFRWYTWFYLFKAENFHANLESKNDFQTSHNTLTYSNCSHAAWRSIEWADEGVFVVE